MQRGHPFPSGGVYHIFNRGAHKQAIFTTECDYDRFLLLMYLTNKQSSFRIGNLIEKYKGRSSLHILDNIEIPAGERLVHLLAYALMPNHFHFVLKQNVEGGISTYMHKLLTAYSMYFNTKYEHSGVLFQGRFKSKLIDSDAYHRYIFAYVHLNPIDLAYPEWGEKRLSRPEKAQEFLQQYRYCSYTDYVGKERTASKILSKDEAPDFLGEEDDFEEMLQWNSLPFDEDSY